MSRLTAILKSRQKFPKPEANWNFGDFSKIQPGAGANDVAGWTGESLKAGLATIDLTQTTAAAQPTWQQGYDPDGSDLVVNGGFDTDISGWTDNSELSGSISWDASGAISLNNPAGSSSEEGMAYQLIPTVNGQAYTFTLSRSGGGSIIQIGTGIESNTYFQSGNNTDAISISFTALSANTYITLRNFNKMIPSLIDSVTLHEAVVNDSKSRIVFDGSDYLEGMPTQTGDFTYITKLSTENAASSVILGHPLNAIQMLYLTASGLVVYRSSLNIDRTSTGDINDGLDYVVALTRIGSLITIYVDSVSVLSVTDAGDFLVEWLGDRFGTDLGFDGNMSNTLIYPIALTAAEVAAKTVSLA